MWLLPNEGVPPPSEEDILSYLSRSENLHDWAVHGWQKIYEAALALGHLHDLRVYHANLKPANVRIGSDGRAKLVGFELSESLDRLNYTESHKPDEAFRWQAPFLLNGSKPSLRCDVYSLAMCIISLWDPNLLGD
ncbi:Protein kinase-like domain [Phytophthora cactorum]|nr:Protein kinase-like domain [Phytophthora cactorum]